MAATRTHGQWRRTVRRSPGGARPAAGSPPQSRSGERQHGGVTSATATRCADRGCPHDQHRGEQQEAATGHQQGLRRIGTGGSSQTPRRNARCRVARLRAATLVAAESGHPQGGPGRARGCTAILRDVPPGLVLDRRRIAAIRSTARHLGATRSASAADAVRRMLAVQRRAPGASRRSGCALMAHRGRSGRGARCGCRCPLLAAAWNATSRRRRGPCLAPLAHGSRRSPRGVTPRRARDHDSDIERAEGAVQRP